MLDLHYFNMVVGYLADIKVWRISEETRMQIYDQVCSLVDESEFERIAEGLSVLEWAKPDSIVREVKRHRRQVRLAESGPDAHGGPLGVRTSHMGAALADEYLKFRRVLTMLKRRQSCPYGGCSQGRCRCFAEAWAEPITAQERIQGQSLENSVLAAFRR